MQSEKVLLQIRSEAGEYVEPPKEVVVCSREEHKYFFKRASTLSLCDKKNKQHCLHNVPRSIFHDRFSKIDFP